MHRDHGATGAREFADLHQTARDDAVEGGADLREAARGGGLDRPGAGRLHGRERDFVARLRLVERGLADELLRDQALRAFEVGLRGGQRGFRLGDARAAGGDLRIGVARVEAGEDLALLHPVAGVHVVGRDAAVDLGGEGGLLDGLDDGVGGVDLVEFTRFDAHGRRGAAVVRPGRGQCRDGEQREGECVQGSGESGVSHGRYCIQVGVWVV